MKVPTARMIETREIETAPSLVFDCSVGGDASAPLVLMLHGFCVSRYFWDNQIPVLAATGYFAVAPNQRGYAVGTFINRRKPRTRSCLGGGGQSGFR